MTQFFDILLHFIAYLFIMNLGKKTILIFLCVKGNLYMKNSVKAILIIGAVVLILAGVSVTGAFLNRIPKNPISTTGNTAGNLNNDGLFAESEGVVYFSNSFDSGCMYSMNPDETNIKKINHSNTKNILTGGDYLYYYMDTSDGGQGMGYVVKTFGLYRSKNNGRDAKCLDREAIVQMQLVGDYIYYQRYNNKDFTKLCRIRTDKKDFETISDSVINPVCAYNGEIYFNGTEKDHYLYVLNTQNNEISTLYEGNMWFPSYSNGYIYFLDVGNKLRLARFNLSDHVTEILTKESVDTFNVGDFYVYFQTSGKNPALYRMELNGQNPEKISDGVFNSLNLTDRYLYFKAFGDDTTMYHTPVIGDINVSIFEGAMEAAYTNEK